MRTAYLVPACAMAFIGLTSAPSSAQQDIGWTWNSSDHDGKANFESTGEIYHAVEYHGNTYVDWSGPSGSGRWWVTGTGVTRSLNFDWAEGKTVTLKSCEEHTAFPDDCSDKKYGVS